MEGWIAITDYVFSSEPSQKFSIYGLFGYGHGEDLRNDVIEPYFSAPGQKRDAYVNCSCSSRNKSIDVRII